MMSDKIIIPFEGKKKEEVDSAGIFSFIGFERLRMLLNAEEGISGRESITGLIIDQNGIKIRIDKWP